MDYHRETETMGRQVMPDLVRAFAILGIVVVNVAYFAWPGEVIYEDGGLDNLADKAAYFTTNSLALFKSYSLFSLMFGVGLWYQMQSARRSGAGFGGRYLRRTIGLVVLGALHIYFAFVGDILIIYATLGVALLLFRNASVTRLRRWGTGFIVLHVLVGIAAAVALWSFGTFSPDEFLALQDELLGDTAYATAIYQDGNLWEVGAHRMRDYLAYFVFSLSLQAPGIYGFFLWGLALAKSGLIAAPGAAAWSRARRVALPIGFAISLVGAAILWISPGALSVTALIGWAVIQLGAPFATLGYLGLIAKWASGPTSALKTFMARGGTATLSAYLLQSVILSLVFSGYGLGLYGEVGALGCTLIAVAVGVSTLVFTSLWRRRFTRGPVEKVLRRWTYLGDGQPRQV